jgi:hypothetical protein
MATTASAFRHGRPSFWTLAATSIVALTIASAPVLAQTTGSTGQKTTPTLPSGTSTSGSQTQSPQIVPQLPADFLEELMLELLMWEFVNQGGNPMDPEAFIDFLAAFEQAMAEAFGTTDTTTTQPPATTGGGTSTPQGTMPKTTTPPTKGSSTTPK